MTEPGDDAPIAVRQASEADLGEVMALVSQAHRCQLDQRDGDIWALADAALQAESRLVARLSGGLVLLGTVLGVPVGVAVVRLDPVATGTLAFIEELYTQPEARRVGVGRRLIDAVESWAIEAGCLGIDSVALPGDRNTKNFFEAAGLIARAITVHRALPQPSSEP